MTHFAIHIDDMDRAKNFYEEVFEWGVASYGPADFLQIKPDQTDNGELIGALQSRRYSPVKEKIVGLECTVSVENIEEIIKKVEAKRKELDSLQKKITVMQAKKDSIQNALSKNIVSIKQKLYKATSTKDVSRIKKRKRNRGRKNL